MTKTIVKPTLARRYCLICNRWTVEYQEESLIHFLCFCPTISAMEFKQIGGSV